MEKVGISVMVYDKRKNEDYSFISDEVFNEKSAEEITDIFHSLGGSLSLIDYKDYNSGYKKMFPLIDAFYNRYKSVIKKVRLTLNKNLLYSVVDKKAFLEYENYLKDTLNSATIRKGLSDDQIKKANDLIDKMTFEEPVDLRAHLTQIKGYLEALKAQGKVVKTFDENLENLSNEYQNIADDIQQKR